MHLDWYISEATVEREARLHQMRIDKHNRLASKTGEEGGQATAEEC